MGKSPSNVHFAIRNSLPKEIWKSMWIDTGNGEQKRYTSVLNYLFRESIASKDQKRIARKESEDFLTSLLIPEGQKAPERKHTMTLLELDFFNVDQER